MTEKSVKLNSLQKRTLALFQLLAGSPETGTLNEKTGEVTIFGPGQLMASAHGDHLHIGQYVIAGSDASGFANEAVWRALARKGLIIISAFPMQLTLTRRGLAFDTGLMDQFEHSDH